MQILIFFLSYYFKLVFVEIELLPSVAIDIIAYVNFRKFISSEKKVGDVKHFVISG